MANQHTKKLEVAQQTAAVDPAFAHALPGPTNEEIRAKQAELEALRAQQGYPRVEFGRDEQEKKSDARRAGVKTGVAVELPEDHDKRFEAWADLEHDPLGLKDPLEALKQQYQRPDFSVKLLSSDVTGHLGQRGYLPIKDKNGDVVKFGKMTLGEMPTKYAERRKAAAIADAKDKIRSVNDGMRNELERLRAEAKGMGLELIERGEKAPDAHGMDRAMGISVERIDAA